MRKCLLGHVFHVRPNDTRFLRLSSRSSEDFRVSKVPTSSDRDQNIDSGYRNPS